MATPSRGIGATLFSPWQKRVEAKIRPFRGADRQAVNRSSPWPHAQDLFGCSRSTRFARSTAGGINSPMPAHARSAAASS